MDTGRGDRLLFRHRLLLQPVQAEGGKPPLIEVTSGWWLVAGVGAAAFLTFLGGFSKTDNLTPSATRELVARTLFAAGAFAIWSFVVPASWWYSIDALAENKAIVPFVAGLVGAAFALLAEGVVRRVGRDKRVAMACITIALAGALLFYLYYRYLAN